MKGEHLQTLVSRYEDYEYICSRVCLECYLVYGIFITLHTVSVPRTLIITNKCMCV